MPKSIISIDVDDARFKEFHALYSKYVESLKTMPGAWGAVGKETDKTLTSVEAIAAAMFAQTEVLGSMLARQKAAAAKAKELSSSWVDIASSTKKAALNIGEATEKLLKWTAITGAVSGLLGAGGIYGIDRLATSAGASRRSAQGLGTTIGGQSAFGVNYGRLVEPGSFLSGVNESLTDYSKRGALLSAGLQPGELSGTTDQVADRLLLRLKTLADQTPTAALGNVFGARRLGQFMSPEDFQRLKATSPEELQRFHQGFAHDIGALGIGDDTARRWQDFLVQLDRAGAEIKTVLINGLEPLAKPLGDLSESVIKSFKSLLASPHLGEDIEAFGKGIESAASYIGSKQFQDDAQAFGEGLAKLVHGIGDAVIWLGDHFGTSGGTTTSSVTGQRVPAGPFDKPINTLLESLGLPPATKTPAANNYFGIRPAGQSTGFQSYGTSEDAIRAAARQVYRDEYVYGQTTLRQLVYGNDNHGGWTATDRENYLKGLEQKTGLGADAPLDYRNDAQLGAIVSAIGRQETGANVPPRVVIEIMNNTGGNAVVNASQIPQ